MKNLFIDSNIWLSLYHFTNDDLAQFSKLKDMVNKSIRPVSYTHLTLPTKA